MPAPTSRPRSRALLPTLPQTFTTTIRLPFRQLRTLSLRGPAVLLSKPTSFTPETDSKLLVLSPTNNPLPQSKLHVLLSGLRLTFPDPTTRDAFLAAAHAAIQQLSTGVQRYTIWSKVRSRVSACMYLVRRKDDGVLFWMKMVPKQAMDCESRLEGVVAERAVLAEAAGRRIPFIHTLVDAFETDTHLCLVLERPEYGDMRRVLEALRNGKLTERVTRKLFAEMVLGVEECHRMGYLYRGVKLGAIRLNGRGHIKLGEFGLAKRMEVETMCGSGSDSGRDDADALDDHRFQLVGRTNSFVGAKRYMSPEQISGGGGGKVGYGVEADVWALGVVLYVMLVGEFPFAQGMAGSDEESLYDAICGQALQFPQGVRKEARALLEGLLHKDVAKRWDVNRVKNCAWMRGVDWRDLRFHAEHDEPQKDVLNDLKMNGVGMETCPKEERELSFTRISLESGGSGASSGSLWNSEGRGKVAELVGFGHINYPQRL